MFILNILGVFLLLNGALVLSKNTSGASKLIEKEMKNSAEITCKSTKLRSLMKLREEDSKDKIVACLVKVLDSHSDNALLWTILGETYSKRNERSKANTCFKESTRLMGKLSKYIQEWHFIGPFPIGKPEVDGDPLEDWAGVKNASKHRWADRIVYYSELVPKGELRWKTVNVHSASESVNIAPAVDWNELVMSLQSMGITEWQGWIIGDIVVNEDCTVLFQCLGVHTMYVDDVMVTGDVYRRDQFWHPVYLTRGIHTIQIKLRSKGPVSFNLNFKQASNKLPVKVLPPPFLPDLVEGKLFSKYIPIPVSNLHSSNWIKISKISETKQTLGGHFTVKLLKENENFALAPGQVRNVVIQIDYRGVNTAEKSSNAGCSDVSLSLKFSFSMGKDQKLDLILRCRKANESFLFTFFDHDGSVQHGAAIAPIKSCDSGTCPVLLTLHGTTVPPQNQADSYKRMENGQWVFGVEHLWILAPTRHGAHNWEGPGELTAITALKSLSRLTREISWIKTKAHDQQMVIAGHSMGGHGAWQLGIHYPDHALAVISAAGWIKKEDYGDSNLFFRHDVSTSHLDPSVKWILEACTAENDADKHISNLHGLPVMIRTGAEDRTVPPYYSRRMYRLLREQRSNVTYAEIAGKEHWWWDTYSTNDGGVSNDPVIRDFAVRHAKDAGKQGKSASCDPLDHGSGCGEKSAAEKYQQPGLLATDRNLAGDGVFTLTVYNPASSAGVRGVRVIQQIIPFRQSTVQISLSSGTAVLHTTNVARLSLDEPAVSPVHWSQRSLEIDGVEFNHEEHKGEVLGKSLSLCKMDRIRWAICQDKDLYEESTRGPMNMGPARRVAEGPFLIVTGTLGDASTVQTLRQFAVYIANLFHLTSDAMAPVITDRDLDDRTAEKYNLIVIGRPSENHWAERFHKKVPLKYRNKEVILGDCSYTFSRTGVLFLAPHAGNRLTLVLSGNSLEGLRDVIHLATPTIPPMTRSPFSNFIPDYVITGPRFGARGPGGYLCTGFWGNNWEYRRDISSCAC